MRKSNCTLQHAAVLGLAGMTGALFTACSYFPDLRASAAPSIKPVFITRSADTAHSFYDLGKYYFWQNRFDKAREAFEQALKLQANNVDALNGLGAVHDRLGQFDAAQQAYRQALAVAPEAAHIWANLGYSLLLQGRPDMAIASLEKAIALDAANTVARQHLAQAAEASAKLAARAPSIPAPVADSPTQAPEAPTATDTISKPLMLVESVKPMGAALVTVMPRVRATHSNLMTVSYARPVPAEQQAPASVRIADTRAAPVAMTAAAPQPPAPKAAPVVSATPAALNFGRTRIEISNGNGVNGMARALSAAMKMEGANVTRVTNALPFDKPRTTIICANDVKGAADAIAKLLPGNPDIRLGSTAERNVDIRVVLGADAARIWSSSKKVVLATLDK